MRLLLFVALATIALACPPEYRMLARGQCFKFHSNGTSNLSEEQVLSEALTACNKDGASLPIILNDSDNDLFNMVASQVEGYDKMKLLLGLKCNTGTRQLQWVDRTKVEYSKNNLKMPTDCTLHETVVSDPAKNVWNQTDSQTTKMSFIALCVTPPSMFVTDPCEDYTQQDEETGNGPCFKFYKKDLSWNEAEKACEDESATLARIDNKDENNFIRRSANAVYYSSGLHIGLHRTDDQWSWIDGSNITYVNGIAFASGDCGAMLADNSNGFWVNINCDTERQPYACRREVTNYEPPTCDKLQLPAKETLILPGGYPHSTISCEYILVASQSESSRMELTITMLEANELYDFLIVYDGYVNATVLANLSGVLTDGDQIVITTSISNYMKVSWQPGEQPNNAVNVRGFKMRYTTIDPIEPSTIVTEEVIETTIPSTTVTVEITESTIVTTPDSEIVTDSSTVLTTTSEIVESSSPSTTITEEITQSTTITTPDSEIVTESTTVLTTTAEVVESTSPSTSVTEESTLFTTDTATSS